MEKSPESTHIAMGKSALVLPMDSSISLAIARSLGRRNVRVIGVAVNENANALKSKHLTHSYVLPWCKERPEPFIDKVFEIARRHGVTALLTVSETLMAAFNNFRSSAPDYLRFGFPISTILDSLLKKEVLLSAAESTGLTIPRTYTVRSGRDLAQQIDELRFPVMLKFSSVGKRPDSPKWRFKSRFVEHPDDLRRMAKDLPSLEVPLLVQEYAHGRYESIGLAISKGKAVAAFQWAALRELAGGIGTFRVSRPLDPDLMEKSLALLTRSQYEGVAEVEFRHDLKRNVYTLMEVNPRLWGGVAFPIYCGVDFAWLSYLIAIGAPITEMMSYPAGVYSRNLSSDARWLYRVLTGRYIQDHINLRVNRRQGTVAFLKSLGKAKVYDQESLHDFSPTAK